MSNPLNRLGSSLKPGGTQSRSSDWVAVKQWLVAAVCRSSPSHSDMLAITGEAPRQFFQSFRGLRETPPRWRPATGKDRADSPQAAAFASLDDGVIRTPRPTFRSQGKFWSDKAKMKGSAACLLLVALAMCPWVSAQEKGEDKPAGKPAGVKAIQLGRVPQKVFQIKHADVDKLAQVLRIFPANVNPNRDLGVIAVQAETGVLSAVEETIRRLDVPQPAPKNIELTAYLILASNEEQKVDSIPVELETVIKQMKSTFTFRGFRTLDTVVVRSRDKHIGSVRGVVKLSSEATPTAYSLEFRSVSVLPADKGSSVRIDAMRLNVSIPNTIGTGGTGFHTAGFVTDLDIREGQKVIVGKTAVGETNSALILVLTAKVLE